MFIRQEGISNFMQDDGKIKTTINISEDLWKKFSILVIEEHGYRKKNEIIEQIIEEYVDNREKTRK